MKRWLVVGALVLCAAGVLVLFLESESAHVGGRGAGAVRDPQHGSLSGGPGAEERGGGRAAAAAAPSRVDDDPNRVPGADLLLRGEVRADGKPVKGAEVAVLRAGDRNKEKLLVARTAADDTGHFAIAVARRTRLALEARAKGHAPARMLLLMPREGDPEPVVLELGKPYALDGIVVTEAGDPVQGARVVLTVLDWRTPSLEQACESDEKGRFGFTDLADARYSLRAEAEGWPAVDSWAQVPLMKGVVLRLPRGGSIAGTVKDDKGSPIAGATVRIQSGESSRTITGWQEARTGAQGEYRIAQAVPGWLMEAVVGWPPSLVRSSNQGEIVLPLSRVRAGEELRVDLTLEAGIAAEGLAVAEGTGAPVAGARISLMRLAPDARSFAEIRDTRSGPDGRFSFPGVAAGDYAFEAKAEGLARLVPRWTQSAPLKADFSVGEGPPPETIRISLVAAGRIFGRMLGLPSDGIARSGVFLEGVPDVPTATLDDTARYEFPAVPATDRATVKCWNPQASSEPFAVAAGASVEIDIDVRVHQGFAGRVADPSGKPVPGARVRAVVVSGLAQEIKNAASNPENGGVLTGDDGRYALDPPEWQRSNAGRQKWALIATSRGFVTAVATDLEPPENGATTQHDFTLDTGGTVAGRVEFAGGAAAQSVYVSLYPTPDPKNPVDPRGNLTAYTDLDGLFAFEGVGEGSYTASAYHAESQADAVKDVIAGMKDLRFVFRPTESIEGIVVDEDDKPVPQFTIAAVLDAKDHENRYWGGAYGGGRFRIASLWPGSFVIEVSPDQRNQGPRFETTRTAPTPTGTRDLVIRVASGLAIAGRVVGPDAQGVAGADVVALPTALTKEQRANQSRRTPTARTDSKGAFSLKGLGPEQVEILVLAAGFEPRTELASPGRDLLRLQLSRGESIRGRLLLPDDAPVAGQWIQFLPVDEEAKALVQDWQARAGQSWQSVNSWRLTSVSTGVNGDFEMQGLRRGRYRLNIYRQDAAAPDVVLDTGAGVRTIRLESPRTLRGRLLDPGGGVAAPEEGKAWWITARRGEVWLRGSQVDAKGEFEIGGLPPGPLTIQIWAPPYDMMTVDVEAGGATVTVSLRGGAKSR